MQVSATSQLVDGRTYYVYECLAPYGSVGPHTLTSMTTKVCLPPRVLTAMHPNMYVCVHGSVMCDGRMPKCHVIASFVLTMSFCS